MFAVVMQFQSQADQIREGMRILQDVCGGPIREARGFAGALGLTVPRTAQGLALTLWDTTDNARVTRALFLPIEPYLRCTLIGPAERRIYAVTACQEIGAARYARVTQTVRRRDTVGWYAGDSARKPLPGYVRSQGFLAMVDDVWGSTLDIGLWDGCPAWPQIGHAQGNDQGDRAETTDWKVGEPHVATYTVRFQVAALQPLDGTVRACPGVALVLPSRR